MRPLLSREEIEALFDKTERLLMTSSKKLTIDTENQRIILHNLFDLEQDKLIHLNLKLSSSYLLWYKDEVVACGKLVAIDGKLVLKVAGLVDRNHCGIVE